MVDLVRVLSDHRLWIAGNGGSRANLSGADLSGADLFVGGQRTDGYVFFVTKEDTGPMIRAGCRYFNISDARTHWQSTRGGTELGEESLALVDHIERVAKIRGWIV